MSKIGKKPIKIPERVVVEINEGEVRVRGAKGELSFKIPGNLSVEVSEKEVVVKRKDDNKTTKSLHGLFARTIQNAILGVSGGWIKTLELVGAGYRAKLDGKKLVLSCGFSHPVVISPPENIMFTISENKITVLGQDKILVGQVAANIRAVRKPEPYQGKGIRYEGEYVRRKAGKSVKTQAA